MRKQGESTKNIEKHGKTGRIRRKSKNTRKPEELRKNIKKKGKQGESEKNIEQHGETGENVEKHGKQGKT